MSTLPYAALPPLPLTLADAALPGSRQLWKDAALVIGASALTALSAQVAIPLPWTAVPLSGQTFAVLLTGAALGWRRGFLAQVAYLAEGAAGAPVFAQGLGGVATLFGPTCGYLFAFPFAAALTGFLAEKGWDRRFASMALSMVLGTLVIYAMGLAGLARFVPTDKLLASGLLPFLGGDALKILAAASLFPAAWKLCGNKPKA